MQLLRMKRQEKSNLIQLCRALESARGARYGVKYSRNAGRSRDSVKFHYPKLSYLLLSKNIWLREGCIFYSKGWGWRVRKGWRDVVKQISCSDERVSK